MKKLSDLVSLDGQSEDITISDLRGQPGEVLAQVELGKKFTVTRTGKPVAEITKPEVFDWGSLQALRKASP